MKLAGDPEQAVRELEGAVFSRTIDQSEVGDYRNNYDVISTQLKGVKLHIRVLVVRIIFLAVRIVQVVFPCILLFECLG